MGFQADIASDVQQPSVGEIVELFEIELEGSGGTGTLYFTKNIGSDNETAIDFNSRTYIPIDVEASGWEVSGEGALPRPTLKVSNVLFSIASHVIGFEDLVGAKLIRRRTLKRYLDGEDEANPAAEFPQDIYVIDQKLNHNKYFIEFQLAAYMDFEGTMLPKRQILRDTCTHVYRNYDSDSTSFIYTNATCPYTGEHCYDKTGEYEIDESLDVCGKRLKDCELRYSGTKAEAAELLGATIYIQDAAPGAPVVDDYWLDSNSGPPNIWYKYKATGWSVVKPDQLPTRAFPGVARTRVSVR